MQDLGGLDHGCVGQRGRVCRFIPRGSGQLQGGDEPAVVLGYPGFHTTCGSFECLGPNGRPEPFPPECGGRHREPDDLRRGLDPGREVKGRFGCKQYQPESAGPRESGARTGDTPQEDPAGPEPPQP